MLYRGSGASKQLRNSVDYYTLAIIYYELKKFDGASSNASRALKANQRDKLLSKESYDACVRIQAGPKR